MKRYQDSAAVMVRLKSFGDHFASRFAELGAFTRFIVSGAPSSQVKEALSGANAVYMPPAIGPAGSRRPRQHRVKLITTTED